MQTTVALSQAWNGSTKKAALKSCLIRYQYRSSLFVHIDFRINHFTEGRPGACLWVNINPGHNMEPATTALSVDFKAVFLTRAVTADGQTEALAIQAALMFMGWDNTWSGDKPILISLQAFKDWLPPKSDPLIWGNGASFDNVILANAYRAASIQQPWAYWNDRCYRTLKKRYLDIALRRQGTHHNALDDAISQAEHLITIWKEKRQ